MVIAGIKKRKTKGASVHNPSILAYPFSKILKSRGKTQINKPLISKKTIITIYPINELKKFLISLLNNVNMK